MYYIIAILAIGLIIIVHEGGHFLLARANGIGVMEFSVGFGPKLLSTVINGTRYSLKAIPFGGSCIMRGDDMAIDDPVVQEYHEGKDDIFYQKPVWSRISAVLAGPVFNLLLGYVFALIIVAAVGVNLPVVDSVREGYPAETAGIMAGDQIIKINNTRVYLFEDISLYLNSHKTEPMEVTFLRDGEKMVTTIVPTIEEDGVHYFGVYASAREKVSPLQTLKYSYFLVRYSIKGTLDGLRMLFTSGKDGINQLSGPVGVTKVVGEVTQQASRDGILYVILNLLNIMIPISVCLGIMNLLPLPALDGGRLVFLLIEAFTGKKVPRDKESIVHFIGLIFLLILSVIVMFKDILQLFHH